MRFATGLAVVLCAVLISSLAQAQKALPYKPEERFKVTMDESDGAGASNVVIRQIDLATAPNFIRNQAMVIASDCTMSGGNISRIMVFSYTSDLNRSRKLPDNYVLDLTPLKGEKVKHCIFGRICENGMCNLLGYASMEKGRWALNFSTPAVSWGQQTRQKEDKGTPRKTTLLISTLAKKGCGAEGGVLSDDEKTCTKEYIWGTYGLAPFQK
ncbi:MAG: hypothetical protein WC464_07525 [Bdellovibrionales bacterium]